MASTKKAIAAAAILANVDLKKPSYDDNGKLRVDDLAELASEYCDTQAEIDLLTEAQKERKAKILEVAMARRNEEEAAGRFYKTVVLGTNTDDTLQVIWGDRYSTVDMTHEPLLRRVFGKMYDDLFEPALTVKPDKAATVERIREILGDARFDALSRLLKFETAIKLRSGFMESRADMRKSLDETTNRALDTVVGQVQASPSVKVMAAKE